MKIKALLLIIGAVVVFTAVPASATSRSRVLVTLNTVGADLGEISTTASETDLTGLSSACDALFRDASTGLGYSRPASVNRTAWRHIKNAWSLFARAGLLCGQGADEVDVDLIRSATGLIKQGSNETNLANEAL